MQNQPLIFAGGGLVVGVLLAVAISGSLTDGKLENALEQADEASTAALADATEALEARIAELESSLGEGAAATEAAVADRIAQLEAAVGERMDAVSAAAEARVQDLEAAMSDLAATAVSSGDTGADAPSAQMQNSGPLGVGQTAVFMDGAVRAFVTALDRESGAARLSINGETVSLGLGGATAVSVDGAECSVAVTALDAAGVTIGSDCGMEGTQGAAADVPPAPEDGYAPGTVAILADGALRVFVSGMAEDGSSARIAINGVDTRTVAAGSSVSVTAGEQSCEVTVTGVGAGIVGLEGSCS